MLAQATNVRTQTLFALTFHRDGVLNFQQERLSGKSVHNPVMSTLDDLNLVQIRKYISHCYRRGGGSRPDVALVEYQGDKAVLKDHNACDRGFAFVLGPILARREARALRCLHDLAMVPCLRRRVERRALLMAHLDAQPAVSLQRDVPQTSEYWREFFVKLSATIEKMHRLGVAHCDLRSPHNVLIDADGQPVLVDFVACVFRGKSWNPLARWLFKQFVKLDQSAVIKLKQRLVPELVSDEDVHAMTRNDTIGTLARNFGVAVRNVSRLLFTREP